MRPTLKKGWCFFSSGSAAVQHSALSTNQCSVLISAQSEQLITTATRTRTGCTPCHTHQWQPYCRKLFCMPWGHSSGDVSTACFCFQIITCFSYPWKPLINYFKGCSYADSYKHFWDQHKCPSNQAWHYVCLYFQAFSNFAFLSAIDAALFYYYPVLSFLVDRPFSVLTLIMWSLCLMSAPSSCPVIVKLLSLVHLLLAYRYVPHFVNAPLELYAIGGFAVVTLIHLLVSKKKLVATSEIALYLSLILLKIISLYYLEKMYGGVLKKLDSELLVVFSVIMIGLCCLKDPVKGSVVFGSFGASTLSVLIGRPALLLLSYAYSASILQGLAHALSREQATLLKLQTEADRDQKITYEWGHVVYFPNLLLHSIYTTLSKKSTKKL